MMMRRDDGGEPATQQPSSQARVPRRAAATPKRAYAELSDVEEGGEDGEDRPAPKAKK